MRQLKNVLKVKKIGVGGPLDAQATGLLIMLFGECAVCFKSKLVSFGALGLEAMPAVQVGLWQDLLCSILEWCVIGPQPTECSKQLSWFVHLLQHVHH